MKTLATASLKRIRALELGRERAPYDEVAEAVGYGHKGSAHRAVSRALKERLVDGVELRTDLGHMLSASGKRRKDAATRASIAETLNTQPMLYRGSC
jgi:hypothetical protein